MTELKPGLLGKGLSLLAVITGADWHRVRFAWEGSNRILYVDGAEIAKDIRGALAGSVGGLYFGAGKRLEPGTFWTGLIDDVRIYDRAVMP